MIDYSIGKPSTVGVYACRRVADHGLPEDIFLMWSEGKWWYLGSDQRCSYEILGWIGPLRRRLPVSPPKTKCSVCGEDQFSTPSGISCKNGHGGADPIEPVDLFA